MVKESQLNDKELSLRKCPFCGCTAKMYKGKYHYFIQCHYCNTHGKSFETSPIGSHFLAPYMVETDKQVIDELINHWNNRIT